MNMVRTFSVLSAILGIAGAWLVGYSVIDKFKSDVEYTTFASGAAIKTPEYKAWAEKNDTRTWWGLTLISVSGVLQIIGAFVPPPSEPPASTVASQPSKPSS